MLLFFAICVLTNLCWLRGKPATSRENQLMYREGDLGSNYLRLEDNAVPTPINITLLPMWVAHEGGLVDAFTECLTQDQARVHARGNTAV
jgi:hypothetical protein